MYIDPDTNIIKNICTDLIGAKINIGYTIILANGNKYNGDIENCNIIGNSMENIIIPLLINKIPTIERGPKQASPDFFNRNRSYEWEIKFFNVSPSFDISNYMSYICQLEENTFRKLYKTQYLVFKYSIFNKYIIIDDFKILNVWNIVSFSGKYPISIQNKKGMWYNIRPCSFNEMSLKNKNAHLFIKNILKSILQCPNNIIDREKIIENIGKQFYKLQFNEVLSSIKNFYI